MYSWPFPQNKFLPVELLGQGSCVFVKASNTRFPSEMLFTLCSAVHKKIYFLGSLSTLGDIMKKIKRNFCQFYS